MESISVTAQNMKGILPRFYSKATLYQSSSGAMIVIFPQQIDMWRLTLRDNVFIAKPNGPFQQLRMLSTHDHGFPQEKIDVFTNYDTGDGRFLYIVTSDEAAHVLEPAGNNPEWAVERYARIRVGLESILHCTPFRLLPLVQVPTALFRFTECETSGNIAEAVYLYVEADKYTGENKRVFLGKPGQMKRVNILSERERRGWGTEMRTSEGTLFLSADQKPNPIWVDNEGYVSILEQRDITYRGAEVLQLGIPEMEQR